MYALLNFACESKRLHVKIIKNHVFTYHLILYNREVSILLQGVRVFNVQFAVGIPHIQYILFHCK